MHRLRPSLIAATMLALAAACEPPTTVDDLTPGPLMSAIAAAGAWGAAVSVDPGGSAGINTGALEGCPIESRDGLSLFFASNRDGNIDIWTARRGSRSEEWSQPEKLPEPVNSAANDFCPTPLPGGGLMFVSTRAGGCGAADIYQATFHPTRGWIGLEHLGCTVNSAGNEFSPSFVAASGGLLFFSSNRGGQDDIYVSRRGPDGWESPEPVDALNATGANTVRPNVSVDGRLIVFDSNRAGGFGGTDIWYASRPSPNAPWSAPVHLGLEVNSEYNESRASLSTDGQRLYFGSNRPGQGDSDLYVASRR